uniref:Uncharacterized protein n=1 Tax=Meloidogyne enterolobii TaxID=390850 RepID=A0A6V7W598_MELEN|nr:unnamed protein product [Meloidogyne enterolobii]
MAQIPRLSDDVLYIISEKLLFKKFRRQVDLRITNSYTLFMYHSARNIRSFFSHFSKMKRLRFLTWNNDCFICFYKEETPNFTISCPYLVSKNMFSGLLEARLLRISSIQASNILGKLSKIDFSVTNKNIWKYLLNLEEGLSDSSISSSLNISKIIVNEKAEIIKKHLITLLSMNIETMEIICSDIKNIMFYCDPKTFELVLLERPSISMNCTKKIKTKCTIELKSITNFVNNLMNYIQFLLLCCPNLDSIEFLFNFDSDFICSQSRSYQLISLEEFVTNLELFFTSIIDSLKILEIGGKDLKITVEFCSTFFDFIFDFIPTNNKLFSLGKHIEKNLLVDTTNVNYLNKSSEYYAREIEIVDSVGRQHKCLFKIFSLMCTFSFLLIFSE